MKAIIALALAVGTTVVATAPADAAQGCGRGFHRGPYGRCLPNGGPGAFGPGPVVGTYYRDRGGYWDGHRYWHNRRQWHGGWRYY